MYTRESVSTDRYNNGDDSGSGRDEVQNTTTVSSDWSVRPSDDAAADSTQTNSLSRLNPAAVPFSFTGGAVSGGGGGAGGISAGAGGPGSINHNNHNSHSDLVGGGGSGGAMHHAHIPHHGSMLSGNSLDGALSPPIMGGSRGLGGPAGMSLNGNNSGSGSNNGGVGGGVGSMGMDAGSPNSFGMMQGMMASMPYGMVGAHRQSSLPGRPVSMMDFGMMHGGGGGPVGGGPMNGGGSGMGRMGGGMGNGITSPNSFLPPPGEDTDQQELMRLQQTNYRVKMLPPPLTYEVHRKIWSKNEYGDDNDDDVHGSMEQQEEESLHSLANEDPIDKEQRLEAYKQIMLRWYSHIHVLEGKSEVAKRLVRVRRACPSMEEVMAGLSNQSQSQPPQPPSGAATNTTTGSEGGDEDNSLSQHPQQQQQQQPPAATRRSPSEPLDTEEILATWSAQCWDWWQETVKRKPRRARKQGELPLGGLPGLPTSASAPMVAAMGGGGVNGGSGGAGGLGLRDGLMPHSFSARALDMDVSSPHLSNGGGMGMNGSVGGGSPYSHHGPYTSYQHGSPMDAAAAAAMMGGAGGNGSPHNGANGMPMAPSYTSFTDLSEEGAVEAAAARSMGAAGQPQQPSSHSSPLIPLQQQQQRQATPPQPQPPQQLAGSHNATPPASMFTTNGIRAAAPRSGNADDFLENDHLTLAFTTELLKSLEE